VPKQLQRTSVCVRVRVFLTGLEDIESTKEQEVLDSLAVLLSAG